MKKYYKLDSFYSFGLFFIIQFLSLFSSLYIIINRNYSYKLLYLLPFVFFIANFFSIRLYNSFFRYFTSSILIIGYFLRLVICPLLFCMGGYKSLFYVVINNYCLDLAILSIALECFIVMTMCNFSKYLVLEENNKVTNKIINYDDKSIKLILLFLIIFLLFSIIVVPTIATVYKPIYKVSLTDLVSLHWDNDTIVSRGTIERILFSLFSIIWPIVRLLLPAFLISKVIKKEKVLIWTILALLVPFIFLSSDNIAPFTVAIIVFLVVIRIAGKKVIPIFLVFGLLFIILFISILTIKLDNFSSWRGAEGIALFAQILNAYVPGIDNAAMIYSITNVNKFTTLFYDIYYAIPFKETIFGFSGEGLHDLFTSFARTQGQIMPFNSQLGFYVSPIFAPFITAIIMRIAQKKEYQSRKVNDYWQIFIYIYLIVLLSISIHFYSFSILLRSLVYQFIPLYVICTLQKRKKVT